MKKDFDLSQEDYELFLNKYGEEPANNLKEYINKLDILFGNMFSNSPILSEYITKDDFFDFDIVGDTIYDTDGTHSDPKIWFGDGEDYGFYIVLEDMTAILQGNTNIDIASWHLYFAYDYAGIEIHHLSTHCKGELNNYNLNNWLVSFIRFIIVFGRDFIDNGYRDFIFKIDADGFIYE